MVSFFKGLAFEALRWDMAPARELLDYAKYPLSGDNVRPFASDHLKDLLEPAQARLPKPHPVAMIAARPSRSLVEYCQYRLVLSQNDPLFHRCTTRSSKMTNLFRVGGIESFSPAQCAPRRDKQGLILWFDHKPPRGGAIFPATI